MNFTTNIVLVEHTIFTFLNVQMPIAVGMNPQDLEKFLILGSPYQNPGKAWDTVCNYCANCNKYWENSEMHPLSQGTCSICKEKLSDAHKRTIKAMLNYFQYAYGTVSHELPIDDKKKDLRVLEMLHCWENVSYESPMEITYYSSKIFKNLCFYC